MTTHMIAKPIPRVDEPTDQDDLEATLRDVRAFLDDPLALLERAADLVRRGDR